MAFPKIYAVKDKEGNIDFEIIRQDNCLWTIHYPAFQMDSAKIGFKTPFFGGCFVKNMTSEHLALMLYSYNIDEYKKFIKFWIENHRTE